MLLEARDKSMSGLYEQSGFPVLQNRIFRTASEARLTPRGDISLQGHPLYGFIYNELFSSAEVTYDATYINEQGLSSHFKTHLNSVSLVVERLLGKRGLLELGCGQGRFLEIMESRGASIVGIDPAYRGNRPNIFRETFDSQDFSIYRGVILRHVLEHIEDPVTFLRALNKSTQGALVYIEVPCLEWILQRRAWYDIFYEHVNYFRKADFYQLFNSVIEQGHLFGGQYLYVVASLRNLNDDFLQISVSDNLEKDFTSMHDQLEKDMESSMSELVWGASSKGVIYSLLRERYGKPLLAAVDINSEKWGSYLPGTGLEVLSPSQAISRFPSRTRVTIMNENYMDEVASITEQRFELTGVHSE